VLVALSAVRHHHVSHHLSALAASHLRPVEGIRYRRAPECPTALVIVRRSAQELSPHGATARRDVLRGPSNLNIYAGQILAIVVGASGAGKSTLLHCIGTLDLPTRGRIRLAG